MDRVKCMRILFGSSRNVNNNTRRLKERSLKRDGKKARGEKCSRGYSGGMASNCQPESWRFRDENFCCAMLRKEGRKNF